MAPRKISALPSVLAAAITDASVVPIVVNGETSKTAISELRAAVASGLAQNPIRVKDYGAIADGISHPLSERFPTLAEAQIVYPFITSLTQTIDYAAVKKASDAAFGAYTAEHGETNARLNRPLLFDPGFYHLGSDTWLLRNTSGAQILGSGRRSTRIRSNACVFRTDGLWYSEISGLTFECLSSGATVAVDIDGNVPGQPYATRGVQGNTLRDVFIDGGGSSYALAMVRLGGSAAQGSENVYLNVHLNNASFACYYQNGFNSLANIFVGGNFQNYTKHGAYIVAGQISFWETGFQSGAGYAQITNDGFDIDASSAGVVERIVMIGCRTESLRFFRGSGSQTGVLLGNQSRNSVIVWTPSTAVTLNQLIVKVVSGRERLFRVTTAGTTASVEPTWTAGVVSDGTATWTETQFYAVDSSYSGRVIDIGNAWQTGFTRNGYDDNHDMVAVNSNYTPTGLRNETIFVDASGGNRTITLPTTLQNGTADAPARGREYTIKKTETSANTVTIACSDGSAGPDVVSTVIPGGSQGYCSVKFAEDYAGTYRYRIVSKSF